MVVRTDTPDVHDARKFVLTLIFSERNHFCMYCQMSGGDCELQNAAYGEDMTEWPLQPNWEPYPVDGSHQHFVLDHNRCILCRRCVRACGELVGNFTLGAQERGSDSILVADLNVPLGDSSCISCGTCVQVCPTGAIIDRLSAYRGRETDVERTKTTCAGCSVGCGIEMIVRDNHLLRIEGDWDAPVNGGLLCEVGRFLPLDEERERILTPLVRKNGALKAATWKEALGIVSEKMKPLIGQNGDNVAAVASTRLPVEGLHLFKQIFADKMGSEMVTSIEEGLPTAMPGLVAEEIGQPFEGTLDVLDSADCVVAVGVDLVANHQVAGFFVKRNLSNGAKLINIDPFDNGLHTLADYPLRLKEGKDLDLLVGIMAEIIKAGQAKGEPINTPDLSKHNLESLSQVTGIPAETIKAVSQTLASAEKPAFVYGKGVARGRFPTVLKALLDLARIVGALDNDHSAVVCTKGQANSMAAQQYNLNKPFEASERKAIYVALGDDNPTERLIKRLEGAPFLAVQASYVSPVVEMADVVLPAEMWAEQKGHYLNFEGRLQEVRRGLIPPEDIRSHVDILQALATEMNLSLTGYWQEELNKRIPTNAILGL
jgi:formate dehydrogenase major subunit